MHTWMIKNPNLRKFRMFIIVCIAVEMSFNAWTDSLNERESQYLYFHATIWCCQMQRLNHLKDVNRLVILWITIYCHRCCYLLQLKSFFLYSRFISIENVELWSIRSFGEFDEERGQRKRNVRCEPRCGKRQSKVNIQIFRLVVLMYPNLQNSIFCSDFQSIV